jgi:hypothetical protein
MKWLRGIVGTLAIWFGTAFIATGLIAVIRLVRFGKVISAKQLGNLVTQASIGFLLALVCLGILVVRRASRTLVIIMFFIFGEIFTVYVIDESTKDAPLGLILDQQRLNRTSFAPPQPIA